MKKKKKAMRKKIAATLAAGALLCAGTVFAEQEETVFQLDQVTVTADRTAGTVAKTAANVTVITGEEIKNKGARTLADALTGVSGVIVQRPGGQGEYSNIYILGSDMVVVLIDGKRMNLPQGSSYGHSGVDFNSILLAENVERIEVVRGGASALYGADAVGGVINIITKKGDGVTHVTTSIAAGNYGGTDYTISAGGQENNTRWHFTGIQNESDGQRTNSAYKGKDVSFRLDQDLTQGESLTFTYDYHGTHAGLPGSTRPGFEQPPGDFHDILRHNWSIGYTKEHKSGNRIFSYYDNNQVYSGENFGTFRHKNTVRAFEYQDSAKLNDANFLTWGGEWRKEKVISDYDNGYSSSFYDKNRTNTALFLQNQYDINSISKLTLGLRWDNNSAYGTHWSPKVAYLYQASVNTSYFANWGKVFRAPSFDDLYWYEDWGFGAGMFGDPNLKPETGWTAEVGVKTKINNANEATLSMFKRSLKDAIKWRQDPPASGAYYCKNLDRLEAIGVNANLISILSPAVTSDIGYTYLNSHDQDHKSVGDPRHSFHIGVNIRSGKWKQGIYGVYQDKSGIDGDEVGGYFTVNTNTSYSLNKKASLFLTINNLFNKEYEAKKYYPANKFNYLFGVKYSM